MPAEPANGLHLADLSIRNFRGIDRLSIRRLGRVTLLGGRNGAGKTTVLEAVRTYAARGDRNTLNALLDQREEYVAGLDEAHDAAASPNYAALFHGRTAMPGCQISIGPDSGADDLRIEVSTPADWSQEQAATFTDLLMELGHQGLAGEMDLRAVKVVYRGRERLLPWLTLRSGSHGVRSRRPLQSDLFNEEKWPVVECESLGPGVPGNRQLARFWDQVALTEEEDLVLQALRLMDDGIERVTMVGDEETLRFVGRGRRVVVKLRDHERPVPLKSLGDGVTHLFAAALALANSRDGFLVLDEAENGIHHSVQRGFWRMVLRAAHQNNVQVLATTHSSDCVAGFARAAIECDDALGVYVRLERDDIRVRAVEYTEEELETVADQGIEVR